MVQLQASPRSEGYVNYQLAFFGPNAEELAGVVYDPEPDRFPTRESFLGESEIIFSGQRGER